MLCKNDCLGRRIKDLLLDTLSLHVHTLQHYKPQTPTLLSSWTPVLVSRVDTEKTYCTSEKPAAIFMLKAS